MSVDSLLSVLRDYQGIFGGVLGGVFTLVGGALAYCAVRRQIRSNERIAEMEARATRQHLYAAAAVELRGILNAVRLAKLAVVDVPSNVTPQELLTRSRDTLIGCSTAALQGVETRWTFVLAATIGAVQRAISIPNIGETPDASPPIIADIDLTDRCLTDQLAAMEDGASIEEIRQAVGPLLERDFLERQFS